MKKGKSKWLILLLIGATVGGMFMFHNHQKHDEELKRNREYEVSLVNALKNSYEGIEEIRIKNPEYSSIPSDSWGADVEIRFLDNTVIKHEMAYDLIDQKIKLGVYNENDKNVERELNSRRGKTMGDIIVSYSNGEKGRQ